MSHNATPKEVTFEYEEHSVIPVAASFDNGSPYTGKAQGANGAADWHGSFLDGRPHGAFMIDWGGTHGGLCTFEHGRRIEANSQDEA